MNEPTDLERIKTRIWLTSKSRMEAEKRYKNFDNSSHIFLCLCSVILISISVFADKISPSVPTDSYLIIFSVAIVVLSAIIFGFSFGKTAVLHRECYLKLQKLHDSRSEVEEIEESFHKILSQYPNHTAIDYERLILNKTFFHSSSMTAPDGSAIEWSWLMLGKIAGFLLLLWVIPFVLICAIVGSLFVAW